MLPSGKSGLLWKEQVVGWLWKEPVIVIDLDLHYKHEAVSKKISKSYNFGCIVTAGIGFYQVIAWIDRKCLWLMWSKSDLIALGNAVTFFRWSGQIYSRLVSSFLVSPCTENYWNRFIFDRVIPKIKGGVFFWDTVYMRHIRVQYTGAQLMTIKFYLLNTQLMQNCATDW